MMSAAIDPALAKRLEALASAGTACCVDTLQDEVARLRGGIAFGTRLARLKALADENRLLIALLLKRHGEMCSCQLQAALALTHPTVSHHVAQLVHAGVVQSERRGKWVHLRLAPEAAADVQE